VRRFRHLLARNIVSAVKANAKAKVILFAANLADADLGDCHIDAHFTVSCEWGGRSSAVLSVVNVSAGGQSQANVHPL
jgi:hypothetical protein